MAQPNKPEIEVTEEVEFDDLMEEDDDIGDDEDDEDDEIEQRARRVDEAYQQSVDDRLVP